MPETINTKGDVLVREVFSQHDMINTEKLTYSDAMLAGMEGSISGFDIVVREDGVACTCAVRQNLLVHLTLTHAQ